MFKVIAKDKNARAGVLETPHGLVKTPVFMAVGTQGTVKALDPLDLKAAGAQIILGNTYHLYLRPGSKLIKKMGGLHKFMGWDLPILTDSGGFQAFSLGAMIEQGVKKVGTISTGPASSVSRKSGPRSSVGEPAVDARDPSSESPVNMHRIRKSGKVYDEKSKKIVRHVTVVSEGSVSLVGPGDSQTPLLAKITEEGVVFKSHLDGSIHLLTPEKSMEVQLDLGADIVLTLDELLSPLHQRDYVAQSLERTHRWELRSKGFFDKHREKKREKRGLLFGILQGVYDREIREKEAKWVASQGFDGISIGGSFGTSKYWNGSPSTPLRVNSENGIDWAATKAIYETMGWVTPLLPEDLPRHGLGIGEVADFFECIERGVDMFDCVSPTRRARNGSLYISPKNGGSVKNKFVIAISNARFVADKNPIDPGCGCYTCQNFSRSYLKHLYISSEILYHRLASIHNVYFCVHLVDQIRESIINKQFAKLKSKWLG